MKISELLVELEKEMWQNGDLDVYVHFSCGCCDHVDEPDLAVSVKPQERTYDDPPGLYLN